MEEDDILYQSIIADPEQVSPDVDVSGFRTQTPTDSRLLGGISEFPGLQYDPTQYSSYADLYDLYSRGLPMVDTGTTATTPAVTTPVVETGGESQVTGGLDLEEPIQQPDTTVSNVFEGSPFIETSPNVLSAVNAQGQPIAGNIIDPATGNVYAPGNYSDVAGTTSDPREVIDVSTPASQFVNQGFMEDDYGIYDPDVPTSSILDQTFTSTPANTNISTIPEIALDSEFIDPAGGITQPTLNPAGTGDAEIASNIAAADREAANIPGIDPIVDSSEIVGIPTPTIQQPIDFSVIDSQTADELGAQFTPMQVEEAQKPENVDLYNKVIDGTKTAASFIADKGSTLYNIYQIAQGGFTGAIGGLNLLGLNPVTGLLGLVGSGFKNTPSQQEYESYSDETKKIIDNLYNTGPMQGMNVVSAFGKGVEATIDEKISNLENVIANPNRDTSNVYTIDKEGNIIFTPSFNSAEKQLSQLNKAKDAIAKDKTPALTQEQINDRDDVFEEDQGTTAFEEAEKEFAITGDYDVFSGLGNTTSVTSPKTATPTFDPNADYYTGSDEEDKDNENTSSPSPANNGNISTASAALSGSFTTSYPSPSPAPSSDSGSSGGGKIVCTMMNKTYGFGSFRNKIWLRQSKDLAPEYQKGYHKIFLPLVRLSKTNIVIRKILEHIAVHRTIDIRQESRGKTHILGRVYRKVLEPICYLVGKYGKR